LGAAGQPLAAVLLPGHDVNDAHRHIVIRRGHLCDNYFYCFFTVLLRVFQTILMYVRTVKSANFDRAGQSFVTLTANFYGQLQGLLRQISIFLKTYHSLNIFLF
jgi:hypothetical protein